MPELAELGATLAVARCGQVIARGSQASLTSGLPGELRLRLAPEDAGRELPASLAARAQHCPGGSPPGLAGAGGELRIASTSPPADLAALLAAEFAPVWVDVRRPGLDDLYAALSPEARHAA